MARKSNKDNSNAFPYTPERQLEHPSGWCMTNDHDRCKYQFDHGRCGCDCHTKTQKTQKPREKVVIIANSDDPRPWKRKNE